MHQIPRLGRYILLLHSLLTGVLLGGPLLAQETASSPPTGSLRLDGSSLRLGDRTLRHPVREDVLVGLLGPPERTRYRLLWPGRGVLAVPGETEGQIEELVFVLCEGAPETVRVGVFPGTARIDGVELSCARTAAETLAALPKDFTPPEGLDAFVHAQRAGLEVVVTLSSWDGVLTLAVGFRDPEGPTPPRPDVRVESDSPP